jgi:hypothetical protein
MDKNIFTVLMTLFVVFVGRKKLSKSLEIYDFGAQIKDLQALISNTQKHSFCMLRFLGPKNSLNF